METDEAHVRDILRVLCRHGITRPQLALLHLVLAAGDQGVGSAAVREMLGFGPSQHRGLMASLSKRVNQTPRELQQHDKPGNDLLLEVDWTGGHMTRGVRPGLMEASWRLFELNALPQPRVAEAM